jgi:hypothetical protein
MPPSPIRNLLLLPIRRYSPKILLILHRSGRSKAKAAKETEGEEEECGKNDENGEEKRPLQSLPDRGGGGGGRYSKDDDGRVDEKQESDATKELNLDVLSSFCKKNQFVSVKANVRIL